MKINLKEFLEKDQLITEENIDSFIEEIYKVVINNTIEKINELDKDIRKKLNFPSVYACKDGYKLLTIDNNIFNEEFLNDEKIKVNLIRDLEKDLFIKIDNYKHVIELIKRIFGKDLYNFCKDFINTNNKEMTKEDFVMDIEVTNLFKMNVFINYSTNNGKILLYTFLDE